MEQHKFKNETYDFNLLLVFYSYKKDKSKIQKLMKNEGFNKQEANRFLKNCNGLAIEASPFYILIDTDCFDLTKRKSIIDLISILQHECGHIRQFVLNQIMEEVTVTDSETYLRISDWCFKKCLSSPFFKKIIRTKPLPITTKR